MGTGKLGKSPLWDSSRTRISTITTASSGPLGWSGSGSEAYFVWSIFLKWGRKFLRKATQAFAKKLKSYEEVVAKKPIEQDKRELMNCRCIKRGLLLWDNYGLKFRIYRRKWIPCLQETFTILRQQLWSVPVNPCSESQNNALPRLWTDDRNIFGHFRKRFWKPTCSRRTILSSREFTEFGIIFLPIQTWYHKTYFETTKRIGTKAAGFGDTRTTLPKRSWSLWSEWWNLFSQWYDLLPEISLFRKRILEKFPSSDFPDYDMLDATIASALKGLLDKHVRFRKRVSVEEQRAQKHDRFSRGRQIAYMIYEHFRATGAYEAVQRLSDLFTISSQNDDVQYFDERWDQALLSASEIYTDMILEGFVQVKINGFCSASDFFGVIWPRDCSKRCKGMSTPIASKRPEEWEFAVDSGASMHMLSKNDWRSEEFGDSAEIQVPHSGSNGQWESAYKEAHKYMYTILISSWLCNYSKIRLQLCRLENSAKNTDISMSGSAVLNHGWPNWGRTLFAKHTIPCSSCSRVVIAVQVPVRLPHRHIFKYISKSRFRAKWRSSTG